MNKISNCKFCQAKIVWLKTYNGKNIPVDLPPLTCGDCSNRVDQEEGSYCKPLKDKHGWEPVTKNQSPSVNCPIRSGEIANESILTAVIFDKDYMTAHFATCPNYNRSKK